MLQDHLTHGLDIVFIGINPGAYSDRMGHYFARRTNLFWSALFEAGLVTHPATPQDDARMNEWGFGLTDLVARPTPNMDHLNADEFVRGGEILRKKIERYAPHIACFVGLSGYRAAFDKRAVLGAQPLPWGKTRVYIVPSTSPRNVYYRPQVIEWFKRVKEFRDAVIPGGQHE